MGENAPAVPAPATNATRDATKTFIAAIPGMKRKEIYLWAHEQG